jgi:hypothetical protein
MKRIGTPLACAIAMCVATAAFASPAPNSAMLNTRIFNDCGGSTLITTNTYPASIVIDDDPLGCTGFANLHNWRYSEDGSNPAVFMNGDIFMISADLTISGPGHAEAGLQIAPWFSPNVDGRFNVRSTDGEVAVFGGVLPFYSFTGNHGVVYVKGTTIHLEINYVPNFNTFASQGTMEYKLTYGGNTYSSGQLAMDGCNALEQPTFGCYGILNFAQVGGHMQALFASWAGNGQQVVAEWANITYAPEGKPTPAIPTSWGRVKTMYR